MDSDEECPSRRVKELLPATGVLTKDGIPFYHLRRYALKAAHLQRIKQCGIKLKNGQFSSEENDRLKMNWEKYASTNNVESSRAYEFAGGFSREMNADDRINLLTFQNKTNFVPLMCEGFNDRTGRQVISRMLIIYHPGEKNRPEWNDELEKQFEKLYAEGYSSRSISMRLKRSKAEVDYRINVLRRKTEKPSDFDDCDIELADSTRQVLYGFVTKWLFRKNCPSELEEMLPEKETWNVADFALLQDQEKAMSYLPWISLTWKMLRPVPVIKKFWSEEVERLRAACKRFNGDTEKATNFCMPTLPLISVDEYKRALNLFLEQKPMFPSHVDIEQLQKRIKEENLVGYCTNGLIESEFLKRMLSIHISNSRNSTRAVNLANISYVDWITVIIEYLTHLDGSLRKWHYNKECIRELVSQKLKKKCANVLVSNNGTAMNIDKTNLVSYRAASNKTDKYEQKDSISYSNGLEVDNINSPKLGIDEESTSYNVYTEYFTGKLKNLVESRIQLFDMEQQRKFAKKLKKIMKKDEKLEALQRLVEKMIFKLEDEQKMKLIKKYQKIVRKFQKMQEEEIIRSDVHCELNEAENSKCETANCTDYSKDNAEIFDNTKQSDSVTVSKNCSSKRKKQEVKENQNKKRNKS